MKVTDSKHRLYELMNTFHLNQSELCRKCGITKSSLSNYLNGDREPRQDKLSRIADAFKIDPAWLMGYDTPMYSVTTEGDDVVASEIMSIYRDLNNEGRIDMLKHARYLSSQSEYIKSRKSEMVDA